MKNGEAENEAAKDQERTWASGSQASALDPLGTGHVGTVLSEGSCDPSPAAPELGSGRQLDTSASWLEVEAAQNRRRVWWDWLGQDGVWGTFPWGRRRLWAAEEGPKPPSH